MFGQRYYLAKPVEYPKSKYKSIFKSFDPEKIRDRESRTKFVRSFGLETYTFLINALLACSSWRNIAFEKAMTPDFIEYRHHHNGGLIRLANIAHDLFLDACRTYENSFFPFREIKSTDDWEFYISGVYYGFSEREIEERPIRRLSQVIAICVLFIIDSALCEIEREGFGKRPSNKLLMAYRMFIDAEIDNTHHLETTFQRRKESETASSRANKRHLPNKIIKDEVLRLYESQKWPSMLQAAKQIEPKIRAFCEAKNIRQLSTDRGQQTIYDWIRGTNK